MHRLQSDRHLIEKYDITDVLMAALLHLLQPKKKILLCKSLNELVISCS
jgi:hypothetical protein